MHAPLELTHMYDNAPLTPPPPLPQKNDALGTYKVQRASQLQSSGHSDARHTAAQQVALDAQLAEAKVGRARESRRVAVERGQLAAKQLRLKQARETLEQDLAVANRHEQERRKYTVSQPEHTVIQAREKKLMESSKQHRLERALEDLMLQARGESAVGV